MTVVAMDDRRSARAAQRRPEAPVPEAGASITRLTAAAGSGGPTPSVRLGGLRNSVRPGPTPQAARDLLADAARGLGRAIRADQPADRYAAAHLAALRGAAAVLAARARPRRGRRASAWDLLVGVAPEFAEWSAFFASGSAKRQAAQAGIGRSVTAREADDMVRQAATFLELIEQAMA